MASSPGSTRRRVARRRPRHLAIVAPALREWRTRNTRRRGLAFACHSPRRQRSARLVQRLRRPTVVSAATRTTRWSYAARPPSGSAHRRWHKRRSRTTGPRSCGVTGSRTDSQLVTPWRSGFDTLIGACHRFGEAKRSLRLDGTDPGKAPRSISRTHQTAPGPNSCVMKALQIQAIFAESNEVFGRST
jgi:hypothetical protein